MDHSFSEGAPHTAANFRFKRLGNTAPTRFRAPTEYCFRHMLILMIIHALLDLSKGYIAHGQHVYSGVIAL